MQKATSWTTLPYEQATGDLIWELTRDYSCFLIKNTGLTVSTDPMNLSGFNLKRDSGLANTHAIGIGFESTNRRVKEKKAKKNARVVRFSLRIKTKRRIPKRRLTALPEKTTPHHNNCVYSERRRLTARAIVKTLKRDLTTYRPDLIHLAMLRIRKLHSFKRLNRRTNRAEAKKVKA